MKTKALDVNNKSKFKYNKKSDKKPKIKVINQFYRGIPKSTELGKPSKLDLILQNNSKNLVTLQDGIIKIPQTKSLNYKTRYKPFMNQKKILSKLRNK